MTLITVLAAGSRDNNEHGRIIAVQRSNTWSLSAAHRTFSAVPYQAQIQRADHRFYGSINIPYITHTHTHTQTHRSSKASGMPYIFRNKIESIK